MITLFYICYFLKILFFFKKIKLIFIFLFVQNKQIVEINLLYINFVDLSVTGFEILIISIITQIQI